MYVSVLRQNLSFSFWLFDIRGNWMHLFPEVSSKYSEFSHKILKGKCSKKLFGLFFAHLPFGSSFDNICVTNHIKYFQNLNTGLKNNFSLAEDAYCCHHTFSQRTPYQKKKYALSVKYGSLWSAMLTFNLICTF